MFTRNTSSIFTRSGDLDWNDSPPAVFDASMADGYLPRDACYDIFGDSAPDTSQYYAQAIAQANQLQKQMYDETVARNQPWTGTGQGAINYLGGILNIPGSTPVDPTNALRSTPGYGFAMGQGVNALERGAASKGNLLSGAQQKGLTTFGQGLADQTYQNYLSNLFNVSGQGLQGSSMTGQAGTNYANQAGQNYLTLAQAESQNALNQYNAQQSGYNTLGSGLGMLGGVLTAPFGSTSIAGNALRGLFSGGGGAGGIAQAAMSGGMW